VSAELTEAMMPNVDIDAHLKMLRNMRPSTDPAILAKSSARGRAVAPAHCTAAHALADMIDNYRIQGYSAGEAVQAIVSMIEPLATMPVINTDA
jgi:hypothetical protein